MDSLTIYQQTALQIANSGSRMETPQQLAELRLAADANGRRLFPRYRDLTQMERLSWLGDQFFGLAVLTHTSTTHDVVSVDSVALDNEVMSNPVMKDLTLVEMQEAFRKGIAKEYGDYFGLSYASLIGFLKGFLRCEKKQSATAIVRRHNEKVEQEASSRFFKELYEAQSKGKIKIPDFSKTRVNEPRTKRTITAEESAIHREKVRQQAEEILKRAREEGNE